MNLYYGVDARFPKQYQDENTSERDEGKPVPNLAQGLLENERKSIAKAAKEATKNVGELELIRKTNLKS